MISEFMGLSRTEKAQVITDMVKELAIETGYPIKICIGIIADYKGWSIFRVENYVKLCDADMFYQVAYFQDGNRVYKSQIDREIRRIVIKKIQPLVLSTPHEVSATHIRGIIEEHITQKKWR